MDFLIGAISSIVSILAFVLFAFAVMKIFQIAGLLSEIKDLLSSIKHNVAVPSPVGSSPGAISHAQTGEEMLRALTAQMDEPVNPTSVELGQKS